MAQSIGAGLSWREKAGAWIARKGATVAGKTFTMSDAGEHWQFGGGATYIGKSITERTAMQVSTVWACCRILAEGLGQLPVHVMERDRKTGNLTRIDHDLAEIIDAPNADMVGPEYREARMLNMGLRGNAYSRIERNASGTRINSLYPLKSTDVRVKRRIGGTLYDAATYSKGELVYQVNDRGRWESLPQDQIWHNRIFSLDGVMGLSPIAYAREAMGFSLGMEEFGSRIFGQGLHAGAIIEMPTWLKKEQRDEAYRKLKTQHAGLINTGEPYILEGGAKLASGMIPPKDIEYAGLRGFGVDDLCRFYLVPPHRVARLEKMTNNNIEQLSLEFVMYTLLPYIVKDERSADRWLFNARDRGRYVVRYNYDGLLRGDSEARSRLEAVWLQNGVLTRNEVRAYENLPRSNDAGMDKHTVQSNMISVDDLKAVADAMRGNVGAN